MSSLLPLRGALQGYAWGLSGRKSLAAALHAANTGAAVDGDAPAAELWLGTHPSGPSTLHGSDGTLRDVLRADVPFLLKVLSVARPLSIQAHPDKQRAKILHERRPDKYKDDNHKPEMAVALTPFEGMCSFREAGEISAALERLAPLRALCGGDAALRALDAGEDGLRGAFSSLMRAPAAAVLDALNATEAIVKADEKAQCDADALFLRLRKYYPEDVGCFAAYMLNHVRIEPGQAFFMAANEPHAYLSGQCVEIMACSDNVVRAGLTPKFKDVDTLVEMLTYSTGSPDILSGEKDGDMDGRLYRAAAKEFQLVKYDVAKGESESLAPHAGPGLLLVVQGSGDVECQGEHAVAKKGFAAYLPNATAAKLTAGAEGVVMFRASVNQSAA